MDVQYRYLFDNQQHKNHLVSINQHTYDHGGKEDLFTVNLLD